MSIEFVKINEKLFSKISRVRGFDYKLEIEVAH